MRNLRNLTEMMLEEGRGTFHEIARILDVPVEWVVEVAEDMSEQLAEENE